VIADTSRRGSAADDWAVIVELKSDPSIPPPLRRIALHDAGAKTKGVS